MASSRKLDDIFADARTELTALSRDEARAIVSGTAPRPLPFLHGIAQTAILAVLVGTAAIVATTLWPGDDRHDPRSDSRPRGASAPAGPVAGVTALDSHLTVVSEPAAASATQAEDSTRRAPGPATPSTGKAWGYTFAPGSRLVYSYRWETSQGSFSEGVEREIEMFVSGVEANGDLHLQFALHRDTAWQQPPLAELLPEGVNIVLDRSGVKRFESTISRSGAIIAPDESDDSVLNPDGSPRTPKEVYLVREILKEVPFSILTSQDERRDTSVSSRSVPHFDQDGSMTMQAYVDTTFKSMRYIGIRRIMGVECHAIVSTVVSRDFVADSSSDLLKPRSETLSFDEIYLRKSDCLPVRYVSTSTGKGYDAPGSAMRTEVTLVHEEAPLRSGATSPDPKSID